MGQISDNKTIYLFDLIEKDWCENIDGGNPVYSVDAKEEYSDTIYKILSMTDNISVWKKNEIPERLHYGSADRIKEFVVVADSSWSLLRSSKRRAYSGGAHGYDNQNKDMHAIFYAYGPAFKNSYKHHSINNIDIYPLICKILNIEPAEMDGNLLNVSEMFSN